MLFMRYFSSRMKNNQTDMSSVFIVIPAKNEERYISSLVEQIKALGFEKIVIVNDCSTDNTKKIADSIPDITVLDHVINLGPGAATQTGIAHAIEQNAKMILTIDADLQHDPLDLLKLVAHMTETDSDLVIGSRFIKNNDIPNTRIFYNKVANVVSFFLTGKMLTDSQSGLKAISIKLAKKLDLKYDGFEFCMEIIKQAKVTKSVISEVPVNVRYTPETTAKGQNLRSGINMISRLISPFN